MEKCEICGTNSGNLSAVISGTFYKHVCSACNSKGSQVSSGHAKWLRSMDVEDNEAAIQQPWNADGTINTRFAKLYPKQAAVLFSEDDLRKAER
jgi:hypothetical protein